MANIYRMAPEYKERIKKYCKRCKYRTKLSNVPWPACDEITKTHISNIYYVHGKQLDRRGDPPECLRFVEE